MVLRAIFVALAIFGHLAQANPDLWTQFNALSLKDRPKTIVRTLREMNDQILSEIQERPFTAHQFLGFSGAGYQDQKRYELEFRQRAISLNKRTLRELGDQAVTVYALGATLDGFGIDYKILKSLMAEGKLRNALVVGMASDQAVKYHLEGLEKGWGHVISPDQSIVFLKSTFADSQGNRSWELKTSPSGESDTPKILKDLSHYNNAGFMTFNVFGGGFQAFNETLELILESRNRPHFVEIFLNTDYLPGKIKKDTGYRAAEMLAYVLTKNSYLLNDKIQVKIKREAAAQLGIKDFAATDAFKKLKKDISTAPQRLQELQVEPISPESQALRNYFQVVQKLDRLPLQELENFRLRSSEGLAEARERLKEELLHMTPAEQEQVGSQIDKCLTCSQDAIRLSTRYGRKNRCLELLKYSNP